MEEKPAGNYRKRELPLKAFLVRIGANYFEETNHRKISDMANVISSSKPNLLK